jgi:hypothetical protein
MKRGLLFRSISALLLTSAVAVFGLAQNRQDEGAGCSRPPDSQIDEQERVAEFVIRTYRMAGAGCIQVLKSDEVVFSNEAGGGFIIGMPSTRNPLWAKVVPPGTDITGLGKRNVILTESTGGAHCCYTFRVLELDQDVRQIAALAVQDAEESYFADLDDDGVYEFVTYDYTFAYWHTSFANSPAPRVVLRFNGSRYELALDLMRKPAPTTPDAGHVRSDLGDPLYPRPSLWRNMLTLIYTGHADLAWKLVSSRWPRGVVPREEFLRGFCGQLANSPYFEALRPTLANAPCTFDAKNGKLM